MKYFETDPQKKKRTVTTLATLYPLAFAMAAASSSRGSLVLQRLARARLDAPRHDTAVPLTEVGSNHPALPFSGKYDSVH